MLRTAAQRLLRDVPGFTLIETLVSLVTGLIILGALFAILEVSVHQSTRLADVANATQLGRTAMTRIVDELHSTCLAAGFKPVLAGSNESELIFVNAYSEKAEISVGEKTRKDKIAWNGNNLTDYTYNSTGGTWPNFTFAEKATPVVGTRIGEGISHAENEKKETIVPIFTYYEYAIKPPSKGSTSEASSTLTEVKPPKAGFVEKEAEKVASVLVSFRTAPTSASKEAARSADLSTQVTLAFSAPQSEATIKAAPCE